MIKSIKTVKAVTLDGVAYALNESTTITASIMTIQFLSDITNDMHDGVESVEFTLDDDSTMDPSTEAEDTYLAELINSYNDRGFYKMKDFVNA